MNKEIKFELTNIDLLEAVLKPQEKPLKENQNFTYDIHIEHKINIPEQDLAVVCRINILSKEKEESYGSFKAGCIFNIPNLESFTNDDQDNFLDLPNDLVIVFNSLTISTVRGMMASFYRGTYLHHAILPIINGSTLGLKNAIKEPVKNQSKIRSKKKLVK